jgi:hypothetical protein
MAFDEVLAGRVRRALVRRKALTERKMFGGIGFFLAGKIVAAVMRQGLAVKLGPDGRADALLEPHVRPFGRPGRTMTGWVMIDPEASATDEGVAGWVRRAVAYVKTLPPRG